MIKASEVREQQRKARKFRLEERYSKQIKEVEGLILQAIKEDKTKITIPMEISSLLTLRLSILGLVVHSKEWEEFKILLEENGYTISYLANQVVISWDEALTVQQPLDRFLFSLEKICILIALTTIISPLGEIYGEI